LGETGDELAVYPLVEALVRDDDEGVRAACTQALKALGQNPSAISMLVSQYTDENTHPRVLDVLKSIDPVVADSAVWLHDTAEFYKAAQGLYNRVAHLKRDAGYRNSQVTNLIDQIREEHNGYETLKREEEQIDEVIKAMDPDIDTQIEGLSDPTIEDIKERERIRGEKDEKDRELNSRLDSILNLTYRTLSEILETLGFLDITEVSLDILDQMVGWIVQRGNQLELSGIPPDTQKRIADQTHQLDVLRTELQKLLSEEENSWRQLVQTVWEFREDFRTRSS
jgi:hypothetical protein